MSKNYHLKLVCIVSVSSVLFLSSCGPWCQKTLILSWFALFLSLLCSFCLLVGLGVKKLRSFCVCLFCAFSVFLLALVSINCLFCALSVFLWALVSKNSHLKLVCFVSVSSVLLLSSCGPWCQKNFHLKLVCFVSVSSVLFLSSCGPWCQKTPIFLCLSLLCFFCLLVGLGVNKLSLLCSFCLLVGLGVKKLSS